MAHNFRSFKCHDFHLQLPRCVTVMAKTSLGRRQQSANAMKQTTNYFAVLSLLDNDADNEEAANPAVPPERGSPLSDGLPAELRTQIFKYVLQAKYSVVNVGHLPPYKRGKKYVRTGHER